MKKSQLIPYLAIVYIFLANVSIISANVDINPIKLTTENGMVVIVVENHSLPIVMANMIIKGGSIYDPEEKSGVSSMVAVLLDEGTKSRSSSQISEEIDFIGGSLSAFAGEDYSNASLKVLKKDIKKGFELFSDILMNPAFTDAEIERKRNETLGGIIAEKEDPGSIADKEFDKILFGSHPYHRPVNGTEESVPKITREDIVSYYNNYYRPNNTIIAIVGDITVKEVSELLKTYFGNWKKGKINSPKIPSPPKLDSRKVSLIDKDLTQANIILGGIGIERSNPDFYAVIVMNYIFGGGGFSSRLTENIRENKGLAYSVYSMFNASAYPGSYEISLQTKNESANEAIKSVLREVERMRKEPVTDEELNDTKAYLTGSFALKMDTNSKIASLLTYIEFNQLGLDYFKRYKRLIESVTKEKVLEVAKKYLDPENYLLVVVAKQDSAKIEGVK